jgi:hypothetical protein
MLWCTALGVWLLVLAARRGNFVAPFWTRAAAGTPAVHAP